MILLLAAVPAETERLRNAMHPVEHVRRTTFTLISGRIGAHPVGLLHTGVGKVNTAIALTALLEKIECQAVIQFGCGGAYPDSGLAVGDLAMATEDIYGDEGSHSPDGFLDMQALRLPTSTINSRVFYNRYPLRPNFVESAHAILEPWCDAWDIALKQGPFVTVSTCSGMTDGARALKGRTGGICESMEGAAAAQICTQRQLPFLELRGISNLTLDRNFAHWDLVHGADVAQTAVLHLLEYWEQVMF